MATIAVLGVGYVGLTTGVGLATLGHKVIGLDTSEDRINLLLSGKSPIYEPGLDELLTRVVEQGTLTFTQEYQEAISQAEFVFICVPTPQDEDGSADLTYVLTAAKSASVYLNPGAVVITKSTVPVGSAQRVKSAIGRDDVHVASNPEFLREGSAVYDFNNPDRIVIGAETEEVARLISGLYEQIDTNVVTTSLASAELIKYASNTFLAVKLSFVNDLAALCAATDADIYEVAHGMGLDTRIGNRFLVPGPGWGGSCFPKDTRALNALSEEVGVSMPIVSAAISSNDRAHKRVVDIVSSSFPDGLEGKTIACWGIAFKAHTDDTRESPALAVISRLIGRGAKVVAFDPIAKGPHMAQFDQVDSAIDACRNADALLVLTEWPEFSEIDPSEIVSKLVHPIVVDSRNVLDKNLWKASGLSVIKLGSSQ